MLYFWLRWWSDAKLNCESNIRTEWLMMGVGCPGDREYRDAINGEIDRRAHRQRRAQIAADYRAKLHTPPADMGVTVPTAGGETTGETI